MHDALLHEDIGVFSGARRGGSACPGLDQSEGNPPSSAPRTAAATSAGKVFTPSVRTRCHCHPIECTQQLEPRKGEPMSVASRTVLLVSSYAPLLVLFAILESFGPGWATMTCWIVAAVSVVALIGLWQFQGKALAPIRGRFEQSRSRDADVMAYVVSYVVPFAAAVDPEADEMQLALAVFAALIALLYIRSAVFYVHPLLLLAGVHVYDGERDGVPITLLTRQRHLRHDTTLNVIRISDNTYREVTR